MAETTKETLTGVLASVKFVGGGGEKWKRYDAVLDDGDKYRIIFPPDMEYEPQEGAELSFVKGRFNAWCIDASSIPGADQTSNNGSTKKYSGKKSSGHANTSDGYWKNKTAYEQLERDPKIEFQEYFKLTIELYAAALPHLEEQPATVEEVDGYIDQAYDKARAIYKKVNKKTKKDEE